MAGRCFMALLFATLFLSQSLYSSDLHNQNDTKKNYPLFERDARHFFKTGKGLLSAPFHFQKNDWLRAGLFTTGTALLFLADKPVKQFTQRSQSGFNDVLFGLDRFRMNYPMFLIGSGIYSWGFLAKNPKTRQTGLMAMEAYVYSGLLSGVLKIIIGRHRPYHNDNNLLFKPFQAFKDRYQSLPSGHTITSFAVSTVLAKSAENICWKMLWYGTAGLMGAARIYHNRHWLSDVFAGAVLGYFIADYIVKASKKGQKEYTGLRSNFYFISNGLQLQIYF